MKEPELQEILNENQMDEMEDKIMEGWYGVDFDQEDEIPIMNVQLELDNLQLLNNIDLGNEVDIETVKNLKGVDHESLRKKVGYLWHLRLGHINVQYLRKLKKNST